jgi:predicted N-formylglutamate amidohydrolase
MIRRKCQVLAKRRWRSSGRRRNRILESEKILMIDQKKPILEAETRRLHRLIHAQFGRSFYELSYAAPLSCSRPHVADASFEPLLAAGEAPAREIVNIEGAGSAVVVCDHASNRIPRCLGSLGLGYDDLAAHIAWDPGAAEVARRLAEHLDAPLVLSGYSRLVVDCNRPLESPESIAQESGGTIVPGNRELTETSRAARIEALFRPYHRAITEVLDRRSAARRPSLLLSVHSFTPVLNGDRRPWHLAFSYGRDARLAARLLDAFSRYRDIVVGDNQPYSVDDTTDYTLPLHGERRGLPHVLIEIRQDGLVTEEASAAWAARLAEAYRCTAPSLVT